ncbi:MAG: pyrroline-5-carboxylate reductase [Elusimicrobiota bacterium]
MINRKILFMGAGNMAEAFLRGIITNNDKMAGLITVSDIDEKRLNYIKDKYNVEAQINTKSLNFSDKDVVIIAVKPKDAHKVLGPIDGNLKPGAIIISIMAGVDIEYISTYLPKNAKIARVMPNTAAMAGESMSVVSFSTNITNDEKNIVFNILNSIGKSLEVIEPEMDAITALSGSGPAYVFYLIEAMIEAGKQMGLASETCLILAKQTVLGSIKLLSESVESPSELRKKVTSPGGTTEAAIKYLESKDFQKIFITALQEAKNRSISLRKDLY